MPWDNVKTHPRSGREMCCYDLTRNPTGSVHNQKSFGCGLPGKWAETIWIDDWQMMGCFQLFTLVMSITTWSWSLLLDMSWPRFLLNFWWWACFLWVSFTKLEVLMGKSPIEGECSISMWNYWTVLGVGPSMFSVTSMDHASPYKQLSLSSIRPSWIDVELILIGHVQAWKKNIFQNHLFLYKQGSRCLWPKSSKIKSKSCSYGCSSSKHQNAALAFDSLHRHPTILISVSSACQ